MNNFNGKITDAKYFHFCSDKNDLKNDLYIMNCPNFLSCVHGIL